MDNELKAQLLGKVASSPEKALPLKFSKEIKSYLMKNNYTDIVSFIRSILDKINMHGGCSQFVVGVLELTIREEPEETAEEALFRRQLNGISDLDDEQDQNLEITKVDVPRSNTSWPAVSR